MFRKGKFETNTMQEFSINSMQVKKFSKGKLFKCLNFSPRFLKIFISHFYVYEKKCACNYPIFT